MTRAFTTLLALAGCTSAPPDESGGQDTGGVEHTGETDTDTDTETDTGAIVDTAGGPCDDSDPTNDVPPAYTGSLGKTGWVDAGSSAESYTWALATHGGSFMLSDGCMFAVDGSGAPLIDSGTFAWVGTTHANGSGNKPEPMSLTGEVEGDQILVDVSDTKGDLVLQVRLCRDDRVKVEACD